MEGNRMPNERLRATLHASGYTERGLASELGLDPKSVQRWITKNVTPRRATASRAAKLLAASPIWLWPELASDGEAAAESEVVNLYPHRANTPRHLWLDLLENAQREIWLFANA